MQSLRPHFLKNLLTIGIGSLLTVLFGFVGIVVAVRYIQTEQFGVYVLIEVIVSFFVAFSDFGMGISATKAIASIRGNLLEAADIVNTTLTYRIVVSILFCIIMMVARPLTIFFFKSRLLYDLIPYVTIIFLLSSFDQLISYLLRGYHLYRVISLAQILSCTIKLVLTLYFIITLAMDIRGLIFASIISLIISILFQSIMLPLKIKILVKYDLLKRIFHFGFPLGLNSMLTFIYQKIDTLLIGAVLSPLGVAYYGVATKIPDSLPRLFQSFEMVYLPTMSEHYANEKPLEAEELLNNSLRIVSFITLLGALVATLFRKELIQAIFSDKYIQSSLTFAVLMIALSMELILYILGGTLVAAGQSDKPVKCNIITTVVNLVGNIVMIPLMGFIGAAYARVLSRYIAVPANIWFLKRSNIKVNVNGILMSLVIFWFFETLSFIFQPETILLKIAYIVIFMVSCFTFSIINKTDLVVLLNTIGIDRLTKIVRAQR